VGALTKSYKKSNEQTAREMACSLDLMENWLKADAFILRGSARGYNEEKPFKALISFVNEYINKYGVSKLPQECLDTIAKFSWECPIEDIADASELRRKLP
jgi:hypothetical protein